MVLFGFGGLARPPKAVLLGLLESLFILTDRLFISI